MSRLGFEVGVAISAVALACGADPQSGDSLSGGSGPGGAGSGGGVESSSGTDGSGPDGGPTDGDDGGQPTKLDVGVALDVGGAFPSCKVVDDMNAVGPCDQTAPPDSFEPDVQWSWWGPGLDTSSTVIPLVANLTDDNGDGEVDLCDTPDIVVVAWDGTTIYYESSGLYVLDGASGDLHWSIPDVAASATPAIGDLDGDGVPEIVAMRIDTNSGFGCEGPLVAFDHQGNELWQSPENFGCKFIAVTLADLDGDGSTEIIVGSSVADHTGELLWRAAIPFDEYTTASTAADLDDDGDLEVITARGAYHHDGTVLFEHAALPLQGFPQVGDLDQDGAPEILVAATGGLTLFEHDGTITYQSVRPTGDVAGDWNRPAAIHDLDGDGEAGFVVSSLTHYTAYEATPAIMWTAEVADGSGNAGGTAFDFIGGGKAHALYQDEASLFVFDQDGAPLLETVRSGRTQIEFPVVADVDNDGSAEIIVTSDRWPMSNESPSPTVQVIRDVDDRWVPARRIWNQHAYHVTNVREDGTIPAQPAKSWKHLNTFRTQAQIEGGGGLCQPEPEG